MNVKEIEVSPARVVEILVQYIRDKGLKEGDRLPSVRQIAEETGLGRNGARDGVLLAQAVGLVKVLPRSGIFVSSFQASSFIEAMGYAFEIALFEEDRNFLRVNAARVVIEQYLVVEAASRRTNEDMLPLRQAIQEMADNKDNRELYVRTDEAFHLGIARIAGNEVLEALLKSLLLFCRSFRAKQIQPNAVVSHSEVTHEAIYRAILNGDADVARATMGRHLIHQQKDYMAFIENVPDPDLSSTTVDYEKAAS